MNEKLFETLEHDLRTTLDPPTGKSERTLIPPEVLKLIVEKVIVSIVGSLVIKTGSALWNWWKAKEKELEDVKGRPTKALIAKSQPLIDEVKDKLEKELTVVPLDLSIENSRKLQSEIKVILVEFNFSDVEAERVSEAMTETIYKRIPPRG